MDKSIKIILLITILIIGGGLMFSINNHDSAQKNRNKAKIFNNKTNDNSSSLVLYFSASGTTKEAAESLSKQINAPIQEIIPSKKFPNNYDGVIQMAKKQLDDQSHPKIKNKISNINHFKTIYIGYPTWWQQPPMIIHTLFDNYNFKGKTIILFTTSMSTPISSSQKYINQMAQKDHAKSKKGFRYENPNDIKKFLKK